MKPIMEDSDHVMKVESRPATAVLSNDRYIGCWYTLDTGMVRAFNRQGETNLFADAADAYEWMFGVRRPI